jgi:TRAP-type transport system periplasmic protein
MRLVRSIAGAAMAAAVTVYASPSQAQPVTLTITGAITPGHSSSQAIERIKAEVARRTSNAVDINIVVPDAQLFNTADIIQRVRADNLFAVWLAGTWVSRLVPEIDVVNLPFVFRNYDEAFRVIDGPVGRLIEAKLDAKGFTTLAWMEFGTRNVINAKRPLKTVEDFKGLKIRVQPAEIFAATFRALGATTINVDTGDLYAALANGDADGFDTPAPHVIPFKTYDHMKYLSDTGHMLDFVILIANKKAFMRLTPDQRNVLRTAAREAAAWQRKVAEEDEAKAFEELKAKGLQFDPISPEARVALRKATAGVIDRMKRMTGAELVNKVVSEAERGRQAAATR